MASIIIYKLQTTCPLDSHEPFEDSLIQIIELQVPSLYPYLTPHGNCNKSL